MTGAATPPWAVRYRTADGRTVYVVHNGPDGGPYRPIKGDGDTVRVEYIGDGDAHEGYGWEAPDALTPAETDETGSDA